MLLVQSDYTGNVYAFTSDIMIFILRNDKYAIIYDMASMGCVLFNILDLEVVCKSNPHRLQYAGSANVVQSVRLDSTLLMGHSAMFNSVNRGPNKIGHLIIQYPGAYDLVEIIMGQLY